MILQIILLPVPLALALQAVQDVWVVLGLPEHLKVAPGFQVYWDLVLLQDSGYWYYFSSDVL